MAIVNMSLPDQMKRYIDERVIAGGYSSTSEYMRSLIRDDQKRQAAERLEALLLRGVDSPAADWTDADIEQLKSAVRERLTEQQQSA